MRSRLKGSKGWRLFFEHKDLHGVLGFDKHSEPRLPPRLCFDGRIAQLVEQLTLNQRVLGSSPSAPTIKTVRGLARAAFFFSFYCRESVTKTCVSVSCVAHRAANGVDNPRITGFRGCSVGG
jgi:hypothetical protein